MIFNLKALSPPGVTRVMRRRQVYTHIYSRLLGGKLFEIANDFQPQGSEPSGDHSRDAPKAGIHSYFL